MIDMALIDDRWSDESLDEPPCGLCGAVIAEPPVVRVWRDHPTRTGKKQEIALHWDCEKGGVDAYLALEARLEELTNPTETTALERLRLHALMEQLWKTLTFDEQRQVEGQS